ncbi:threonine-phosphate decarboxylase CobD [Anaeropeptidivorans aminofermentans]|jgi:L-threonine-O-3-phosphate decarboxylase|uniref:threonine-phosphate decarboxylase CobD n=1 Tax=Anaeropeptidivorans aminofermentans TaxID=2934315 RepID=UPI002024BECA|nr:threonine-phosphate decarboxylase CobD [Anaeropeptidivorans aminofermentans]
MEYAHGGDIESYRRKYGKKPLDFSANINPLGLNRAVKEAILQELDNLPPYPDPFCRSLREKTASYENIKEAYILFGNGAADLIFRIALVAKPKKALLLAPTFSEYEQALQTVDCAIEYYFLKEDKEFSLDEDIVDRLNDIDILFLCNPNNPTGIAEEKESVLKILKKCKEKNIILVLDECFNDFLEEPEKYSLKDELAYFDNLIILKSFTKFFAMAGIRLGYLLTSNREVLEKLYYSAQPWAVSTIAQVAGIASLSDIAYIEKTKTVIKEERAYLKKELSDIGFKVYPSMANYIFFSSEMKDLNKLAEKEGILIRSCGNYRGLSEDYYRIAVRSREENEALIEAFKEIRRQYHG